MKRFLFSLFVFSLLLMSLPAPSEAAGGYDQWGYNYQANSFNGYYGNYTRPPVLVTSGDHLSMKWNDAWMDENKVRHAGYSSYLDSGAWLTNHIRYMEDGKLQTYFVKIVAAKSSWTLTAGYWYDAGGAPMGPEIWGEFYIAQETESGSGLITKAPAGPGLGNN